MSAASLPDNPPAPPVCDACNRQVEADELVYSPYEGRWLCLECDVWAIEEERES